MTSAAAAFFFFLGSARVGLLSRWFAGVPCPWSGIATYLTGAAGFGMWWALQ